jgi:RNA polymerase sigma factor (sigma-70 family)
VAITTGLPRRQLTHRKRCRRVPRLTFARRHSGDRLSDTRQLDDAVAPLVRRAQAGDARARDELLRRCHATVYRWALVHTGDPDDADDVAQEVLVRLYTRLDRYAGRARFTTWLYQVTRNAAIGFGRRVASGLRLARNVARQSEAHWAAREDPVKRVQESQVRLIVTDLFRGLPARQREVFHLTEVEGLAASEIGERLGMSPVTVRAHLFRARRALRTKILARHPELAEGRES